MVRTYFLNGGWSLIGGPALAVTTITRHMTKVYILGTNLNKKNHQKHQIKLNPIYVYIGNKMC